jgi:predicted Zn-dependent protease
MRILISWLMAALLILQMGTPAFAQSAKPLTFIRDAEIEQTLRTFSNPIFRAAGLVPENVRIFIVQSDDINAFVAGGQNIFIFTGLIKEMQTPDMLIGVIAHETGHISGGHLARGTEQLKNAQMGAILGFVLGGLAAAAGGGGDAATAVISGSGHLAERGLLIFSRANEQSADQAAVNFLDEVGISAEGMMKTFEVLKRKERQYYGKIDPYAITHPLSNERVVFVRNHVEKSAIPAGKYPAEYNILHERMLAKLYGFMELPPRTFEKYPERDKSVPARMARAIAWHKKAQVTQALKEMDALLKDHPNDGFLHELKGQILFENNRVDEAQKSYERANSLEPDEPLIQTSLAETYISGGGAAALNKATALLEQATRKDNTDGRMWRLLATAYGKLGKLDLSHMALAEESALAQDADGVERNVNQALKTMPKNSPNQLRAEDLRRLAKELREKE